MPCDPGQVRLKVKVLGTPATAWPASANLPVANKARARPTCAEYFTRSDSVSVALPTATSAESNEARAVANAAGPSIAPLMSGVPVERSAKGCPLQKSSADCS